MDRHTRSFSSTRDAVADASSFVLEAAESMGVEDSVREALLLVIGEAVANAAHHGNQLDPSKEVVVECVRRGDELHLCVEDAGPGISEDRLASAALPEDPLQTSGRGLYIMKSLSERIWLEESGRRLCMMWELADGSPS
jgi:serine/threonine-protein kinase RsbW